jgi:hypothetical protein
MCFFFEGTTMPARAYRQYLFFFFEIKAQMLAYLLIILAQRNNLSKAERIRWIFISLRPWTLNPNQPVIMASRVSGTLRVQQIRACLSGATP